MTDKQNVNPERIIIDKNMKIRLLKAIQAGEMSFNDFPEFGRWNLDFYYFMKKAFQVDKEKDT